MGESTPWWHRLWFPRAIAEGVWQRSPLSFALALLSPTALFAPFIGFLLVEEPFGQPPDVILSRWITYTSAAGVFCIFIAVPSTVNPWSARIAASATPAAIFALPWHAASLCYHLRYYPNPQAPQTAADSIISAFGGACWPILMAIGLWFLYMAATDIAWRRLHLAEETGYCSACRYDLRGSLAAGSTTCPECGEPIPLEKLPPLHSDATAIPPVKESEGA